MEMNPMIGLGVSDLQDAVRAEIKRINKATKGDVLAQSKLLTNKLRDFGLITSTEVDPIFRLAEVSFEVGAGKKNARQAYLESRKVYNSLLIGGKASPVALVLASSAVGSYSTVDAADGSGTIVFAKSSGNWENRGATAGALIGSIWGADGAAVGAAVGGLVGHAVDECTD